MAQEEKQLLFKYLSMALPYGVICYYETSDESETMFGKLTINVLKSFISNNPLLSEENQCNVYDYSVVLIKPYLRTLSSMTNIEREEYGLVLCEELSINQISYLLKKHFDFMDLITQGLANEATEGMYN